MQWCISNGVEWLFGILRQHSDGFESIRIDEPIAFDLSLEDTSHIDKLRSNLNPRHTILRRVSTGCSAVRKTLECLIDLGPLVVFCILYKY
jgi:hypothetical protein